MKVKVKHSPEVAPVVHGHFIHDGPRFAGGVDWWHCSNCGKLVSGVEIFFNYCPYCGAKMNKTERIDKKQIINNQTHFNYDKEHDLLYIKLKDCPNHYVDQLEDKYFDLWRDSETDEIVGAHIWNASEWFKMILKTAKEHSTIKPEVTKNTSITNEETAKHCTHNDGTFYCGLTGGCCVCWYNRKVCSKGKLKEEGKNDT